MSKNGLLRFARNDGRVRCRLRRHCVSIPDSSVNTSLGFAARRGAQCRARCVNVYRLA
ncbi:MAG: hypothetical protein OJF48_000266 [Afipia sp.]|nr:MAG: hypothetical protein OJF48_000266 [Afipia sp.]